MKYTITIVAIILGALLIFSCTQGDKKVQLRYITDTGVKLTFLQDTKKVTKYKSCDSTMQEKSSKYQFEITQEVMKHFEDSTMEIFETVAYEYYKPSKDSSRTDTIQNYREKTFKVYPNGKFVSLEYLTKKKLPNLDYMRKYYEQAGPVFPERELSPGDTWTQSTAVVLPDNETLNASTNYKFTSFARENGYDCVVIEYDGNLIIPFEPHPEDKEQVRGVERINTNGIIYFAYKEGITILQREHLIIDGDYTRIALKEKGEKGDLIDYQVTSKLDIDFYLKDIEKKQP